MDVRCWCLKSILVLKGLIKTNNSFSSLVVIHTHRRQPHHALICVYIYISCMLCIFLNILLFSVYTKTMYCIVWNKMIDWLIVNQAGPGWPRTGGGRGGPGWRGGGEGQVDSGREACLTRGLQTDPLLWTRVPHPDSGTRSTKPDSCHSTKIFPIKIDIAINPGALRGYWDWLDGGLAGWKHGWMNA